MVGGRWWICPNLLLYHWLIIIWYTIIELWHKCFSKKPKDAQDMEIIHTEIKEEYYSRI